MKSLIKSFYKVLAVSFILMLFSSSAVAAAPVIDQMQGDEEDAIINAFDYFATQINDDGGIRWMDESSSVAATIRVVQALAAARYEQGFLQSDSGNRPIDFLAQAGGDWVNQAESENPSFSVARAGQLLTAIAAANENPNAFGPGSNDLIYAVKASYDPNTGLYGATTADNVIDQVWAILGLSANAASIPSEAIDWLVDAQLEDGSWNDGYGSYLDTTPLALMALIASGQVEPTSLEVQTAIDFMIANQQPNGGWQTQWDTTTNANTTGVMLQAISSLGQFPMNDNWQKVDGNPQTALLSLQQDSGVIGGDFANTFSTADAIVGLSGQTLFGLGNLQKISLGFDYIVDHQNPDGGWGAVGQTLDIILALQAAGWDPETIVQAELTPLDYVEANLAAYIESGPDAIGKTIISVVAANEDPTRFANIDLIAALEETYDETANAFGVSDNTWHQSFAILGLYAAGQTIPQEVVDTLLSLQQENGGWEYSPGFGTFPDNTALAIQALLVAAISPDSEIIQNALAFIESMQTEDGGWGDSSTTSFVLMALNALGIPQNTWEADLGQAPLPNLFSYQKANGSFVYTWDNPDGNLMSTASALIAALNGDYLIHSSINEDVHFAGLVIDPGEGETQTACVRVEGDTLSGLELLDASGFTYDAPEGFVNSIMDISNPEGETNYWSYWHWNGTEWVFNNVGASESEVLSSSIEAWHFTSWEIFPSLPPDVLPNLDVICGTSVLKNYAVQPYLNYIDVHPLPIIGSAEAESGAESPTESTTATLTPAATVESTSTTAAEVTTAPVHSTLPIFIISGIGLIVVVIIVFILMKKRK